MNEQKIDTRTARTVESLRKHFENRERFEAECKQVVGGAIGAFANFWEMHAEEMEIIATVELKKFLEDENPSAELYTAFKSGLGKMGAFFFRCSQELQNVEGSSEPSQLQDPEDLLAEDSTDQEVAGPDESLDSAH